MSRITSTARYSASSLPSAASTAWSRSRRSRRWGGVSVRSRETRSSNADAWSLAARRPLPLPDPTVQREDPLLLHLPKLADRQIHRDAEEPRVGRGVAAEALDVGQAAGKRFLSQLAGFLAIAHHSQHRVIESVLVEQDDLSVGSAIAALGRVGAEPHPAARLAPIPRAQRRLVMCSAHARHRFGRRKERKVPGKFLHNVSSASQGTPRPGRRSSVTGVQVGHNAIAHRHRQCYRTRRSDFLPPESAEVPFYSEKLEQEENGEPNSRFAVLSCYLRFLMFKKSVAVASTFLK